MPDQEAARVSRARLRKAAEQLYGDSRLRDALTDEEAQQLLSWAYRQLEQAVNRNDAMTEEESAPIVEEKSDAVKDVVRRINAIMDQFAQAAEADSDISQGAFAETLHQFEERAEQADDAPVDEMASVPEMPPTEGPELERDELFRHLMNLVAAEDESE